MNAPRYRAFRFWHADVDDEAPGLSVGAQGRLQMVDERASVRQAIFLLLSTQPGERVMRPTYGCAIHRLTFAPNDDTTAGLAIHYVEHAVRRWEPRVELLEVDATRDPERATRLDVRLRYRVRATSEVDELFVAFDLQ